MASLNYEPITVLVVEDSLPMHGVIRLILSAMRIKDSRFCITVDEAIEKVKERLPDIIITDWVMEPRDGGDFLAWLRTAEDSPNPYIPVIVLTGYSEKSIILKARDCGANAVLAKPVSVEGLYKRFQIIVNNPRPFVRTQDFFGPDRRHADRPFEGDDRRAGDVDATMQQEGEEVAESES